VEALPQYGDHPYQPATIEGVEAGQRGIVLRLGTGQVVEGVVGGPDVEGLEIAFYVATKRMKAAKVGADGAFRISLAEAVAGTLVVVDSKHNRYAVVDGVVPPQSGLAVSLQTGQTISGRVVAGAAEEPLVVFAVDGVVRAYASARADGSFSLSGLPAGTYELRVYAQQSGGGTRAERSGVKAGSTDVVIELPPK
jgi:hypothetical protein